ncbi:MAG: DUF1893 domain-containing protein [Spirochaetaceae bacterium]|nr:MAG: DUF1893 domain-containing protein [Spirochaetaceae bacterium]
MEPPKPSLVLSCAGRQIFSSNGTWLFPLLELERFLLDSAVAAPECWLYDKLVGKAAALLLVRLGIRKLETDLLSDRAAPVLQAHRVSYRFRARIERLDCRTEELLADIDDPEQAHRLILARIDALR